jgi:hypothetical protein
MYSIADSSISLASSTSEPDKWSGGGLGLESVVRIFSDFFGIAESVRPCYHTVLTLLCGKTRGRIGSGRIDEDGRPKTKVPDFNALPPPQLPFFPA